MRLDLTVYGVLLAAGLGAAYWASIPVEEGSEKKVPVFSIDPKSVTQVKFTGNDTDVVAEIRPGDGRYWVTHKKTEAPKPKEPEKPDPHAGIPGMEKDKDKKDEKTAETPPAEPVVKTEKFLANEKMEELLKMLNPLTAERDLGQVDEKSLTEFGLGEKTSSFTITTAGGTKTLTLGKKSYGSRNRFVLVEEGGRKRILLVDDSGFENLERANMRMYDRRLTGTEITDLTRATIAAGDATRKLAHTQRDKNGELLWTDDEENAPAKPTYDSWMDRVSKLRLSGYADEAEEASLAAQKPFLTVDLEKDGKVVDRLQFKKLPGEKPGYFVISEFLKVHGKLVPSRMEPVEKDIATIMGDAKS